MLRVERARPAGLPGYSELLAACPQAMMTHCPEWLDMLEAVTDSPVEILAAWDHSGLVGALPLALSPDYGEGRVLNSLPFFGSHGGPLCRRDADRKKVQAALLEAFDQTAREAGCRAATLILTPYETGLDDLRLLLSPDEEDWRIGQITPLPVDSERILEECVEGKRRNNIRNAQRKGVIVRQRHDDAALDWLRAMHEQSIGAKGGRTKPAGFFDWARNSARADGLCTFLFAELDGRLAAGVLLGRFGDCWEYLVPVLDNALQDSNALPMLVYEGMRRAAQAGARKWNFGGTWKSQEGVYRFKRQFGAEDLSYRYLIRIYDRSLPQMTGSQLSEAFPLFYSLPFRMCAS